VPLGAVLVSGLPMRGGLPSSSMDGGPEPPTWGEPTATVVSTPCTPRDVGLIRVVAATYGSHADMTVDFVEDLRLAVDEACATLAAVAAGDSPLTVVFETTRAGLHIEAWVPTRDGQDVPRDGFGWAVLATLVDAVDGRPSTQADVPGGNGSPAPVAVIAMDKFLPGQRPSALGSGAGQNLSVAR
jgi:serine/threonine-protein kinase RsbW